MITVQFMQQRVKAKVYSSDNLNSFLSRIRCVIEDIKDFEQIGLFQLDESVDIDNSNLENREDLLTKLAPLQDHQIIKDIDDLVTG